MRKPSFRLRGFTLALASLITISGTALSAGLGGSWSGQVTQDDPQLIYPMEMELYGEQGSISYPTLGCGGNLYFVRKDGESYWYREQITVGVGKCIDGGMLMIKPHAIGGSPDWEWNWYGGGATVRGVVRGSGTPK